MFCCVEVVIIFFLIPFPFSISLWIRYYLFIVIVVCFEISKLDRYISFFKSSLFLYNVNMLIS